MELLKWEDIKVNTEYRDQIYGAITIHAKSIIKDERLLVITYGNTDKFPVNFDGMKIFEEIYRVKTLEELGYIKEVGLNYTLRVDDSIFHINISKLDKDYTFRVKGHSDVWLGQEEHNAIELKMIELGLWEER